MGLVAELQPEPSVEEQVKNIVAAWRAQGLAGAEIQRRARRLAAGLCEDAKHGASLDDVATMLRVLAEETKPWAEGAL